MREPTFKQTDSQTLEEDFLQNGEKNSFATKKDLIILKLQLQHEIKNTELRILREIATKIKESEDRTNARIKESENRLNAKIKESENRTNAQIKNLELKIAALTEKTTDLKVEIVKSKNQIIIWLVGFLSTFTIGIATLLLKAFDLF